MLQYKAHKQQWRMILNTKTANGIKIIHQVRTLYMYLDLHTASNSSKMMRWRPLLSPNWKIKGKDESTMTEKTRKIQIVGMRRMWKKDTRKYKRVIWEKVAVEGKRKSADLPLPSSLPFYIRVCASSISRTSRLEQTTRKKENFLIKCQMPMLSSLLRVPKSIYFVI